MSPRVGTVVAGVLSLLLGLSGLVYPERVLGLLGFAVASTAHAAAALGEVRATYGGVFLVLGVSTLLAAGNPAAHRGRLTLLGLVWLGAAAARLFGAYVDGNPGLIGWLSAAFEVAMGGTLVVAAQSRGTVAVEPVATPPAPSPPAPS